MPAPERRPATLAEARALAHPLRQRILRLCLDEELTNKQLADRLRVDPGSLIHHVRKLVATGFLAPGEIRTGARGALEKPYRSTRKSWALHVEDSAEELNVSLAAIDAFRAEVAEAGSESLAGLMRIAATLNETSLDEVTTRLSELVHELAERPPDSDGRPYGIFVGVHRRAWPAPE